MVMGQLLPNLLKLLLGLLFAALAFLKERVNEGGDLASVGACEEALVSARHLLDLQWACQHLWTKGDAWLSYFSCIIYCSFGFGNTEAVMTIKDLNYDTLDLSYCNSTLWILFRD